MIRQAAQVLRRNLRAAVPGALLASMLAAPAQASDALTGTAQLLVLKMNVTENLMFTGAPPCFAISTVQGQGQSTQIGPFTVASTDCINPHGDFNPNGGNVFAFTSQAPGLVLTTPAGHQLFAAYSGIVRRLGGMSGHFLIQGGTGPYFGATGGGMLVGFTRLSPTGTATGTIEAYGTVTLAR